MKYLLTIALAVGAMFGMTACQMTADCCDGSTACADCEDNASAKDASVDTVIEPVTFTVTGMT